MKKLMEIVVYVLAAIGLAFVVKHLRLTNCKKGCYLCSSLGTKAEEIKTKVQKFKAKQKGEKRTGSRYGSNPVKY